MAVHQSSGEGPAPLQWAVRSLLGRRAAPFVFISLLVLYSLYACAFIYRTSFVVSGQRYFALFDDEMISMRYADNLAHHRGLVWNPGESPVEGYTNPLWVLYMAALHLLPVPRAKISLLVQLSGLVLLLLNLVLLRRVVAWVSNGSVSAEILATVLTASYLPLNNWALQGSEVSAGALVTTAEAWLVLRHLSGRSSLGALYFTCGLGTLLRPDLLVPAAVSLGFLAVSDRSNLRRHLLVGAPVVLLFLGGQTLFRLYYFHDLLPNTYYLKLTGFPLLPRLTRGLLVALKFLVDMNPLLPLLVTAFVALRADRRISLLFLIFAGQVLYSIYVGGDAWEYWGGSNRYVVIAMPVFFALLACTLDACAAHLARALPLFSAAAPGTRQQMLLGTFAALSVLSLNMQVGRSRMPGERWDHNGELPFGALLLAKRPILVQYNEAHVRLALLVRQVTDEQARIAVAFAGTTPYFAERTAIDLLGRTDRVVAREPARLSPNSWVWTAFLPGHSKWDYRRSIGELKPDLIVEKTSEETFGWGEAIPYLLNDYGRVGSWYVLRDSPYVHLPPDLAIPR